jgi:hypothetical protein
MAKSFYSKYLNKYISTDLQRLDKDPYYWRQGIGKTRARPPQVLLDIFDETFDITFN